MSKGKKQAWRNRIIKQGMADVQGILFNEDNWRVHPRFQQNVLTGLLEEVGWLQTVIINLRSDTAWGERQNVETLLDGHLRVLLADRNDEAEVPATWVDLTPDEERIALLTFDPVSALAAVDKEKTEKLLAEAKTENEAVRAMLDGIAKKQQALWKSVAKATRGGEWELGEVLDSSPQEAATQARLERIDGDLAGVYELKDWIVFKSELSLGFPPLRDDVLLPIPDKVQAWCGQDYDYEIGVPYLYNWGSDSVDGLDLSATIVGFYVDDYRFEVFSDNPARYTGKLVNAGIMGAVMPNYSMWWEMPQIVRLWNRYRSLWLGRYFQEAGIKVIPDIQLSPEDADFCWLGVPHGVDIAIQFHTRLSEEKFKRKVEFMHQMIQAVEPRRIMVYVDEQYKVRLEQEDFAPLCLFVPSRLAIKRQKMTQKQDGRWDHA
jgi:hypothetical protein